MELLLKVAGQNARHTSFDSAGYRDRFVTELPRAAIPARSERETEEADQAQGG